MIKNGNGEYVKETTIQSKKYISSFDCHNYMQWDRMHMTIGIYLLSCIVGSN